MVPDSAYPSWHSSLSHSNSGPKPILEVQMGLNVSTIRSSLEGLLTFIVSTQRWHICHISVDDNGIWSDIENKFSEPFGPSIVIVRVCM